MSTAVLAVDTPAPTFAEYVPVVSTAVGPGARQLYGTYWRKVVEQWGDRRLDEPTPTEVRELAERCRDTVMRRRNGRGGGGAEEHLIAALRCLYRQAAVDRVVAVGCNPALDVAKPRRPAANGGRVLSESELAEIMTVAAGTGDDPELDGVVVRLHREAACSRGEALQLTSNDLNSKECLVTLRAGTDRARTQPISPPLARALQQLVSQRPGIAAQRLLRYHDGRPITHRRYDHLWQRIGSHLPWVAEEQVSTGWLRRATLERIRYAFGAPVTDAYIRSDHERVQAAVAAGRPVPGMADIVAAPGMADRRIASVGRRSA
ncbi:tyrosine-type recombinase/integrase [Actinoplanes sp. NPDC020271]|uniref:tyrosine-type recombinase/integrase n=1 Tax=Actinoplanes sp. NPDC020271 TaxID=3363896 RepID=UPI0037AB7EDF